MDLLMIVVVGAICFDWGQGWLWAGKLVSWWKRY